MLMMVGSVNGDAKLVLSIDSTLIWYLYCFFLILFLLNSRSIIIKIMYHDISSTLLLWKCVGVLTQNVRCFIKYWLYRERGNYTAKGKTVTSFCWKKTKEKLAVQLTKWEMITFDQLFWLYLSVHPQLRRVNSSWFSFSGPFLHFRDFQQREIWCKWKIYLPMPYL